MLCCLFQWRKLPAASTAAAAGPRRRGPDRAVWTAEKTQKLIEVSEPYHSKWTNQNSLLSARKEPNSWHFGRSILYCHHGHNSGFIQGWQVESGLSLCQHLKSDYNHPIQIIRESFLGFYACHDQSAAGVSSLILEITDGKGLPLKRCRGQGYDGASTMSGVCSVYRCAS